MLAPGRAARLWVKSLKDRDAVRAQHLAAVLAALALARDARRMHRKDRTLFPWNSVNQFGLGP